MNQIKKTKGFIFDIILDVNLYNLLDFLEL